MDRTRRIEARQVQARPRPVAVRAGTRRARSGQAALVTLFCILAVNLAIGQPRPPGHVPAAGAQGGAAGGGAPPPESHFFRVQNFVRGDFNSDAVVDIADASALFNHLFLGGAGTTCLNAADANRDREIDLSDGAYLLNWLFIGGPTLAAPGPFECGIDPVEPQLSCSSYVPCSDDLPLITHVLNRITFGPTEELLTRIQTRGDLIEYIEEQLDDAPAAYDPAIHEPDLDAFNRAFEVGFDADGPIPNRQQVRIKAIPLVDAVTSRWQLLHKIGLFWNNHFHTQINALRNSFFGRGGRGGGASRPNRQQFAAADVDRSNSITAQEWNEFREEHPGVIPYSGFSRQNRDDPSRLTLDEYLSINQVSYWKYANGNQQYAVSADMELREYNAFRRYAFGSFRELAEMHAKSTAQVIYLNNFENTVIEPNENYGREFFELFLLGADHSYTQRDIEEVAKVFTGWWVGWHERSVYDEEDILRISHPEARDYPIVQREPEPFRFAIPTFWDDATYTWGFHFGHRVRNSDDGHDWGRKDLFLPRFGGVDSLGNPMSPAATVRIAANQSNHTVSAAMNEFDRVLDRVVTLRDCRKFICTKLIQLLVTDDISDLARTQDMPPDLVDLFEAADLDGDGALDRDDWDEPTADLPNGKPPEIFAEMDRNADGEISRLEFREPDLLLDAMAAWSTSRGDIREVLRTILLSDEFLSLKFYRAKVKDPFEVIASTLRGIAATPTPQQVMTTVEDLRLAGMELFDFADPTGESEMGFDWMHTVGLLERLKYVNRVANPSTTQEARAEWNPRDYRSRWSLEESEDTVDFFTLLLLGGDVLDQHRELAETAYHDSPRVPNRQARAVVAYIMSLPQFQKQ